MNRTPVHISGPMNDLLTKIHADPHYKPLTDDEYERARRESLAKQSICKPDCPVCQGAGFYHNDQGKVERCPNADTANMYPLERLGLKAGDMHLTWETVKKAGNVLKGVEAVRRVLDRGFGWVYLWGDPGLAKTLILKVAVVEAVKNHRLGAYARMISIIDHMTAAYSATAPQERSEYILDWYAKINLLALDEFEKIKETEYATLRRFLLLDLRYEATTNKENSITLIASNKAPDCYDPYLRDRLEDGRFEVVELRGESKRPAMDWGAA